MLPDTRMYRNEHYPAVTDTPDKPDYDQMAALLDVTYSAVTAVVP